MAKFQIRSQQTTAGKRFLLGKMIGGEFKPKAYSPRSFKTLKGARRAAKRLNR